MPKERGVLARSFHVRKNNERVLNARSVRNEQNVPNVRSNSMHCVVLIVLTFTTLQTRSFRVSWNAREARSNMISGFGHRN